MNRSTACVALTGCFLLGAGVPKNSEAQVEKVVKTKKEVKLSAEQIEKLPSLGAVQLSATDTIEFVLPDSFIGDKFSGRVNLHNGFSTPVTVAGVKASCGCTSILVPVKPIGAGSHSSMVLTMSGSKLGVYSVSVGLQTNKGNVRIQLKGKVLPRVSFSTANAEYLKSKEFKIPVTVHDSRLDVRKVQVFCDGHNVTLNPVDRTSAELIVALKDTTFSRSTLT